MKRYTIVYDRSAEKQLRAIRDRRLALAIKAAIDELSETPRPPGCLKLSGPTGEWRIRVGDWRIVYRIEDGRLVMVVVRVGVTGGVYG